MADKKQVGDSISGGLMLIGLGVLMFTDWWWPGIMVVIGIASCAGLIFRNLWWQALVPAIVFFGIALLSSSPTFWQYFVPMILVGGGIVVLVKAFYLNK